jgi:general secretion pathway protein G
MNIRNSFRRSRPRAGQPSSPQGRSAFTLIELLLVLVILGILAAIVVPKFTNRAQQAKIAAAKQEISTLEGALSLYEQDNGNFPSADQGLTALRVAPGNATGWHGPYLNHDVVNDPWEHQYIYRCPGSHNPDSFDILSMGPDGQEGTADDITNYSK